MLGALVLSAAALGGGGVASGAADLPPRFALSTTALGTNDRVTVRVARPARLRSREIRLYLAPAGDAAAVRSRFDERLSYLGAVRSTRGASTLVTVPPLDGGRYALAYWCQGCLRRPNGVGVQASPALGVDAPAGVECPATVPNGNRPRGASTSGWRFHGNGRLWAPLPRDGVLHTNPLGGHKQIWVGEVGIGAPLAVAYRPYGNPAAPFANASVVSGTLVGYNGLSWASRMSFVSGCWQITARRLDVTLSYVTQVVVPTAP